MVNQNRQVGIGEEDEVEEVTTTSRGDYSVGFGSLSSVQGERCQDDGNDNPDPCEHKRLVRHGQNEDSTWLQQSRESKLHTFKCCHASQPRQQLHWTEHSTISLRSHISLTAREIRCRTGTAWLRVAAAGELGLAQLSTADVVQSRSSDKVPAWKSWLSVPLA